MSLKSIRPSNLVLLAAVPFIVYLFLSSSKYTRSLVAILGIEEGAPGLFTGFLVITLILLSALICTRTYFSKVSDGNFFTKWESLAKFVLPLLLVAIVLSPGLMLPFVFSVVAHSVDPYTSSWIVPTVSPRQLLPEYQDLVADVFRLGLLLYAVFCAAFFVIRVFKRNRLANMFVRSFEATTLILLFHCIFIAHWGFGTGIAVTMRATIFAYILAAIIGIIWTGLQSLKMRKSTVYVYGGIGLICLAVSAYFGSQPKVNYVLVGSIEARIAIIKGTPQSLTDMIRFGEYEDAQSNDVRIRSVADVESALRLIEETEQVSGAFIPMDADYGELPVLTKVSFLPSNFKTPAIVFAVFGALLLILTFGAWQHGMHPLAIASEFFVDTIRGIPMLVIILYVGLPLSGAVKDVTGGGIDFSNMARGIIAIAIGYSAYMAEIFRAGIESIPKGQLEAGASLGLTRWQIARLIVLPQAIRVVLPPLGNEFIAMIKDTSLLSILSVRDVTQRMREFQAASFLPFAPFNTAAIIYVVITLACASLLKWIERRYEQRKD